MTPERVGAIVLAAGAATRFRGADPAAPSKVVAEVDGAPMVRRVADAARAAGLSPIVVVTGFAAADVRAALAGRDVGFAHNADHASGLASSLRVGLAALPADCAGAVILLADMPRVAAPLLARLVDAFRARPDAAAVAPVLRGAWGNPLLLARRVFAEAGALQGDAGARRILQGRDDVVAVEVEDEAVALDVDTPEALAALRRGQMS